MTAEYARTTAAPTLLERLRVEHRQKQRAYVRHYLHCLACNDRRACLQGEYLEDLARSSGNAMDAEAERRVGSVA